MIASVSDLRSRRGVPEGYDIIRVRPPERPPLLRRIASRSRRTLILLALLAVFGYLVLSIYMGATIGTAPRDVPQVQAQLGTRYEDVQFRARTDHIVLKGWLFHADHPNGRSVIFVSGWKANRVNAIDVPVGHDLLTKGYDVLLFDTRGTGLSDGPRQTLGALEQRDVLGAYDYMKTRYAAARMVVYGFSEGGAAVIMAASQMPDVGAIVSDSAFAELRPVIDKGWSDATHLPGATDILGILVLRYLDIDPDLSPAAAIASNRGRAFLLFHSAVDALVPVNQAEELKRESQNPGTQLIVVAQGRAHADTYTAVGEAPTYLASLYAFLNAQIGAHGG